MDAALRREHFGHNVKMTLVRADLGRLDLLLAVRLLGLDLSLFDGEKLRLCVKVIQKLAHHLAGGSPQDAVGFGVVSLGVNVELRRYARTAIKFAYQRSEIEHIEQV